MYYFVQNVIFFKREDAKFIIGSVEELGGLYLLSSLDDLETHA